MHYPLKPFDDLVLKSFQNLVLSFITDHRLFPLSSNEYNMPNGVHDCAWSQLYGTYLICSKAVYYCVCDPPVQCCPSGLAVCVYMF